MDLATYAEIEPLPMEYLWAGKIPFGTITGIFGPEGIAKGLMVADLVSRISRGDEMPDATLGPSAGSVIMMTTEDDPYITMANRLRAAQATLGNVVNMTYLDGEQFYTPDNNDQLRAEIVKRGDVRMVVFDPLADISSVRLTSAVQDVRKKLLNPLLRITKDTGIALVIIMHTTKDAKTLAGSAGIRQTLRSVLTIQVDKTTGVRTMTTEKSNGAPTGPSTAVRYKVVGKGPNTRIQWISTITESVDDLEWIADEHARPGFGGAWSREAGQDRIMTVLKEAQTRGQTMDLREIMSDIGGPYMTTRLLLRKLERHGFVTEECGQFSPVETLNTPPTPDEPAEVSDLVQHRKKHH